MISVDIAKKVQTLLDIEDIKKLHARYAFSIDENRWDQVLDLFAEDAVGDWGSGGEGTRGRYQGKKEIVKFLDLASKEAVMFRHMLLQPEIEVNGDRARAKWYMFGFGTYNLDEGETPAWTHGMYENDLVREDGKWKLAHLRYTFTFQTPYHDGWVKTPSILPTVFKAAREK
jgi:hypothetical protein